MAELPTLPENGDDPDSGGYKGRRAEQDSADVAPMASGPLGGLAQPTAAGHGPAGPVAGQAPPVDSQLAGAQAAAAGQGPAGQPPWGGPVHDPTAGAAGPGWDGAGGGGGVGGSAGPADWAGWTGQGGQGNQVNQGDQGDQGDQVAAAGLAPDGGPEYGLGAVYAPGSGVAGAGSVGYPQPPDQTGAIAPPEATTLAGGATGFDQGGAPWGDPGLTSSTSPTFTPAPGAVGPVAPSGAPDHRGPEQAADGVSFHPGNLDALLSGHPGPPPSPGPAGADAGVGPVTAGTSATDSGIAVSVDGTAVPVGDGGVQVEVGRDGTATVTADPLGTAGASGAAGAAGAAGASGPVGRIAPAPGHGGPGGTSPTQPGQSDPPPDATQVLHGTGADPATVALTVSKSLGDTPVQVVHNPDGSLDLRVAGANGHQVDVHVEHGRDVDIALARDAHGNLLVRADPDATAGTAGGPGGAAGGTDPAGQFGVPGDPPPGPGDPSGSTDAGPDAAAGGSTPPGMGDPPAGGGIPGGGGPTGGGGLPGGGAPTGPAAGPAGPGSGNTGSGNTGSGNGTVKADPAAITKLGTDLTNHAGPMLESAHRRTGDIAVGFPAFGVLGLPLNMAHEQVKNTAQSYLAAGRNQLDSWRTALNQTANNYRDAEDSSTVDGG